MSALQSLFSQFAPFLIIALIIGLVLTISVLFNLAKIFLNITGKETKRSRYH